MAASKPLTAAAIIKDSSLAPKEARVLLAFLLGFSLEHILAHPETEASPTVRRRFRQLEKKRLSGWSLAVLIGRKEFYGFDFHVDKNVLVPRPETELMVDEIISLLRRGENQDFPAGWQTIIDIGTGSGAIIIACARELKDKYPEIYEKTAFFASDISTPALKIAKKNARFNGQARIKFLSGDLSAPFFKKNASIEVSNIFFKKGNNSNNRIIIAANLPYLTPTQVKDSPTIQKEPRLALVAGHDGLNCYRRLFRQLRTSLSKDTDKKKIIIFCEIDPSQNKAITSLAKSYFSTAKINLRKDLAGRKRLAIIEL